jgi:hypothetical protein
VIIAIHAARSLSFNSARARDTSSPSLGQQRNLRLGRLCLRGGISAGPAPVPRAVEDRLEERAVKDRLEERAVKDRLEELAGVGRLARD